MTASAKEADTYTTLTAPPPQKRGNLDDDYYDGQQKYAHVG